MSPTSHPTSPSRLPPVNHAFETRTVGSIPFCVASPEDATTWLLDAEDRRAAPVNVRLANAYNVALADRDPSYRQLLVEEGVNFPDGTPVVWFMNSQLPRTARRVRGPSLFVDVMRAGVERGTRHFLLGGTPETLAQLKEALAATHPGINVVGSYSPPFAPVTAEYIAVCADHIRQTKPDLVWVGLGTPKQDVVGTALAREAMVTTVNVGAAFDFAAGTVRQAPVWVQRSGFEWLYRLASEPRRLWRRYVFGNLRFLRAAFSHRFADGTGGGS
ncbi:WecB/TagA/CpsF family glycosyltransferase [Microbacterium saccharophilum]|uniref:WecB/TagA/CpsF family glycosyltransferase n=1 Tax=Microbacterium saccharophilum TaxID=1213358 RepID=A0A5C8I7M1_9MICO|nr:WecB/TagA/CpsF family glycosyltransferase [Microbacterium saccharophilum]TXK15411.1 WecB/TagA/CpsF family glycosyltransferase [Microbacterium saccharophilum]